jgi:tetratricopeptide (TPR) repeat protein
MKEYFEAASPDRIIGNNLVLEHLHPNVEGYFMMSRAFFDTMRRYGFVENSWEKKKIPPESYYRQSWGITELDHALGKIRIINLMDHWPFRQESESVGAAEKYPPESRAEALAKDVFFDRIPFKSAHRTLAEYYMSQGGNEQAAKEYKAIVTADPFDVMSCNNAASSLLEAGEPDLAAPFLYQSLKLSDSGFANKWIGQILLLKTHLHEGIQYLEKAARYLPDDPQLLFNLCRAYILTGQIDKAKKTFAELEKVDPRFPDIAYLRANVIGGDEKN